MRSQLQRNQRSHPALGDKRRLSDSYRNQDTTQRTGSSAGQEENSMNIDSDDPKWTAYVLGELNETERARVEHELESSATARDVVEEIRMAASLLKQELAKEPLAELTGEQRRRVAAAVAVTPKVRSPFLRWATV